MCLNPEEIAVKLAEHQKEIGSLKHRMDDCEKENKLMTGLVSTVSKLATNMEYMAKEQAKQGKRLETLEHEPTEAFRYYKKTVFSCCITGVLGAFIAALLTLVLK